MGRSMLVRLDLAGIASGERAPTCCRQPSVLSPRRAGSQRDATSRSRSMRHVWGWCSCLYLRLTMPAPVICGSRI